ncbi:MAG: PAS domain S-box protein [Deltaproteobacteria bacterium]|nr:PAS domain S-box protein [Deltaproteobacteria bacterium]
MKLQAKLLVLYLLSTIFILLALGGFFYLRLWEKGLRSIQADISNELHHVDFVLNTFFTEVENDINALVANEAVRASDDHTFTNFLNADEKTFTYHIQEREQKIIDIFNNYGLTHPYVNSVYMGRENGGFVRSHKRASPTRYDPRERPWYILAKNNPGKVMKTDAYPSITTSDVNIGIVRALIDKNGVFYGVVGVDVTLINLTNYIASFKTKPTGKILLVDKKGVILAGLSKEMLFKNVREYSPDLPGIFTEPKSELTPVTVQAEKYYVLFINSTQQNWKIAVLIPFKNIETQIIDKIIMTISGLSVGLILLSLLTFIGLKMYVVKPLNQFIDETRYIAQTSNLDRYININSQDEIGLLAHSYNEMMDALNITYQSLKDSQADLIEHKNHLEKLVTERTSLLEAANESLKIEIKDRIRIGQMLVQSEAKYRNLVESANSIIISWTADGRITFFNRYAQDFFGYNEQEIIGKNIMDVIVPSKESTGRDMSSLVADIANNPESYARSNVNENIRKNGERVWVAWTNRQIVDEKGQLIEILSVGNDITKLKETEEMLRHTLEELAIAKEQAEAADRLKSTFLATMSHELRTPLNSIIGFTGIIAQEMVGPLNDEQKKQLGMVRNSARHLLSLINDVLDISKIEAGQLRVVSEPYDLHDTIEKTVGGMRHLAGKKGLELICTISSGIGTVTGDSRRVEQILLNLISNAIKFTERGSVTIECEPKEKHVTIRVIDTGIGIKDEDMETLFQPFRQVDSGLSRKYEGTGLGLSICKRLVELMGGEIRVTSVWGTGSTFSFSLAKERNNI